MDLSDLIDRNAAFAPEKIALRFDGEALTYAAFAARDAATASRCSRPTIRII
jgi:fatty-acyl-CoA synthase